MAWRLDGISGIEKLYENTRETVETTSYEYHSGFNSADVTIWDRMH